MKTKYFMDCEFIEDGKTIDLVSIGVVCEDGREFYAEVDDVDWSKANQWVLDNVKPHLGKFRDSSGELVPPLSRPQMAHALHTFTLAGKGQPSFWADWGAYDWVVVAQLFGTMMDLPKGWPMYCNDIQQYVMELGNPQLPEQDSTEHNALYDARYTKIKYEWLRRYHLSKLSVDKDVDNS
jgi:3'-5' exoribonuclease-like protein